MAADGTEVSAGGDGGGNKQPQISIVGLFLACMVAGGVQYGWALQLSLLTPYVQVCVCCFWMMSMVAFCFSNMFFLVLSPYIRVYLFFCY
jgi:solute carrier family 45 protein 1/2/4